MQGNLVVDKLTNQLPYEDRQGGGGVRPTECLEEIGTTFRKDRAWGLGGGLYLAVNCGFEGGCLHAIV